MGTARARLTDKWLLMCRGRARNGLSTADASQNQLGCPKIPR